MRFVTIVRVSSIVLLMLVGGCSEKPAPPPVIAQPTPTLSSIKGSRLYVSDERGGRIVVVDLSTGQATVSINVGKRPRGLRLTRDGSQLFVALSGSPIGGPGVDESKLPPADRLADGIGVVDIATGQVVRKLQAGQDPESFDLSPDGSTLYASNEETAELSFVDVLTGEVKSRVKVGEEPEGVTVRPDGREVYVACEGENEVVAVDTASGKTIAHLKVGARPRAIVFAANGRTGFVTNENDGTVSVIDTARHRVVSTIKLPPVEGAPTAPRPMGLALAPDGAHVFVSLGRAKAIAVLDAVTYKVLQTIREIGDRPWGIVVSDDGKSLYAANGPSGDVAIVDVTSGTLTRRISTGGSPWGVVFAK